jgi:hypothetical protein
MVDCTCRQYTSYTNQPDVLVCGRCGGRVRVPDLDDGGLEPPEPADRDVWDGLPGIETG